MQVLAVGSATLGGSVTTGSGSTITIAGDALSVARHVKHGSGARQRLSGNIVFNGVTVGLGGDSGSNTRRNLP